MLRRTAPAFTAANPVPTAGRRCQVGTVGSCGAVLTVRQVNIDTPGQPGHTSPNHTYLTSREVIARFRWGRTFGYQMLSSTGFPRTIGGRYRLDTLIDWEDRVLSGELTGRPDSRDDQADAAPRQITSPTRWSSRRRRRPDRRAHPPSHTWSW